MSNYTTQMLPIPSPILYNIRKFTTQISSQLEQYSGHYVNSPLMSYPTLKIFKALEEPPLLLFGTCVQCRPQPPTICYTSTPLKNAASTVTTKKNHGPSSATALDSQLAANHCLFMLKTNSHTHSCLWPKVFRILCALAPPPYRTYEFPWQYAIT